MRPSRFRVRQNVVPIRGAGQSVKRGMTTAAYSTSKRSPVDGGCPTDWPAMATRERGCHPFSCNVVRPTRRMPSVDPKVRPDGFSYYGWTDVDFARVDAPVC